MNWICKIFGHRIVDWHFHVKMCSRCGFVTDWGLFKVECLRDTISGVGKFTIPKYGEVKPEDL